jgi:hypothetical protein
VPCYKLPKAEREKLPEKHPNRQPYRYWARIIKDGRPEHIYARTWKAANDLLQAAKARALDGDRPASRRLTVAKFLGDWLANAEAGATLRPTTLRNYRGCMKLRLIPGLDRRKLAELTAKDVQDFMTAKLKAGLSPRAANSCRTVLRTALSAAVEQKLVPRNETRWAAAEAGRHRGRGGVPGVRLRRLHDGLQRTGRWRRAGRRVRLLEPHAGQACFGLIRLTSRSTPPAQAPACAAQRPRLRTPARSVP